MKSETLMILPATRGPAETDTGSIKFIGNATVLIRYGNLTILTDPTFIHRHEQVSIGYGMPHHEVDEPRHGNSRFASSGSHRAVTLSRRPFRSGGERELDKSIPIVTTLEAAIELHRTWGSGKPRRWKHGRPSRSKKATCGCGSPPCRDGTDRPLSEIVMPEVMGSMLEFELSGSHRYRLYITGDVDHRRLEGHSTAVSRH